MSLETHISLRIDWSASDTKSLYAIVGNIYSTAGADARNITVSTSTSGVTLPSPSTFTPGSVDSDKIGSLLDVIGVNNDWLFKVAPNMSTTSNTGSVTIDIGANRLGTFEFYITAFDDAGNVRTASQSYNLNDWFVTDGGLAYSAQGTRYISKNTTEDWQDRNTLPPFVLDGSWDESLISSKADLSSEMWAEENDSLDNVDLVDSYVIDGHGGNDISNYYTYLQKAYKENKSKIPDLVEVSTISGNLLQANLISYCGNNKNCVIQHEDSLTVVSGFVCGGKAVIFVSQDLTINTNMINRNNGENSDGCIFVVGGDVYINEGANSSPAIFGYDKLNGYLFANGTVLIKSEATPEGSKSTTSIYDGLYINGGIHSLGGITVNRYLRLIDRLSYPVVAIDHHPKYGVLGGIFFGNNFTLQKVELGFKP